MANLLTLLIVLPLIAAAATYFLGRIHGKGDAYARWSALISTTGIFLLSLTLLAGFDPSIAGFQFAEKVPWFVGYNINYALGIDGISLWLVLLTTFLMPIWLASRTVIWLRE